MARIFIDLTEDERHWNGEIAVTFADSDDLTGNNCALCIGDHQIVLSLPQAITLFDVLDGWLNSGPVRGMGAIERRIIKALKDTVDDHSGAVRAMNARPEELAHVIYANLKANGLRFRLAGEQ